jgi:predicted RNase H-like HicB family nuclease
LKIFVKQLNFEKIYVYYILKLMRFTLVFNKEPEGGYTVEVLELPGCVSYGETIEEAKKMIKDAIKGYIYSLKKH